MNQLKKMKLFNTWSDVIDSHVEKFPERTALVFKDHSVSYSQLQILINACAVHLTRLGIGNGDCVALLCTPRTEALITFLAAAKLGAIWVGLNPKYQASELNYVINHSRPKVIMSLRSFESRSYIEDINQAVANDNFKDSECTVVFFENDSNDQTSLFENLIQTAESKNAFAVATDYKNDQSENPCMLVYTSGTTGKPKGVLLRQKELIFRSTMQDKVFSTDSYPRVINFAPINHIGGMHFRGLTQVLAGGTIIYQERYKPSEITVLINKHKVNMLMLGATMLHMLLEEPSFDMKTFTELEWFIFSGAPIPFPILKKIYELCPKVGSTYGLTESCGSVSYTHFPDPIEEMAFTIGKPVPDGEIRVAGTNGEFLNIGEQGELQVRREFCMAQYLNNEKASEETFTPDGWLKTGDLAICKPNGSFQLVGRIKEMYKSGGYNVYPREIELALEEHPDVLLSAVIPQDDQKYQQVGHAYLILKGDTTLNEQEIIDWCRIRIANYKIPKKIFFCESLPMLSIGKIDKVALKQQSASCQF